MATVRDVPEQPGETREHPARAQREPRYGQPFFPVVPFGASLYILATAIALVVLALKSPAPLQHPADPLNHEQINPRPEWYFLFLFQILKIFQGPLELVGTAIIPAVIGLVLLGLPFYDRNWSRRAARRPVAISLAGLAVAVLLYLTYLPISQTAALQTSSSAYSATVLAQPKWTNIQAIFAKNCQPCHIGAATGGLSLDTYQAVMKGGTGGGPVNGPVIKPGNAAGSYLYQAITGKQKVGARMPANGKVLPPTDIKNIYNWIQNGAKGP
jgi:membrane associated rhomboid family serine protease